MKNRVMLFLYGVLMTITACEKNTDTNRYFELVTGASELHVSAEGVGSEYEVKSNGSWQIVHKGIGTWVKVTDKLGEHDGKFQVTVKANESDQPRTLQLGVLLEGQNHPVTIRVTQQGKVSTGPGDDEYPIRFDSFRIRDPFVLADPVSKKYYIHLNANDGLYPGSPNQIGVIVSEDLRNWRKAGISFNPHTSFWGKTDFWAPDAYYYNGNYYLFATFSSAAGIRGSSIMISDKPEGPFTPLVNAPITPADWMALDASLYVDESGQPWLAYSHEWTQISDGSVVVQKLTEDLKGTDGPPVTVFRASEAPWVIRNSYYVSDAPFLYKAANGHLLMLWSSFLLAPNDTGRYTIGVARSKSGSVLGPWEQDLEPLNPDDDGGHGMIFRDFDGNLKISYHGPNNPTGSERLIIRSIKDNNGKLSIEF